MKMRRFHWAFLALFSATLFASTQLLAQVPYQRILRAASEPQNWLTYSGNYNSQRYSALTQINRQNVSQLRPAWMYQIRRPGVFEASPIVVDGIMYITEPPSTVTALDARTGRPLWTWTPSIPSAADASMARMRPWATLLRKITACSIPGRFMSSTKVPVPVIKRGSSARRIGWPINVAAFISIE